MAITHRFGERNQRGVRMLVVKSLLPKEFLGCQFAELKGGEKTAMPVGPVHLGRHKQAPALGLG